MIDLDRAARQMADLLEGIRDQQWQAATPCEGTSVGDLVDHIAALARAFASAARKQGGPLTGPPPPPNGARLGDDRRRTVPGLVHALAEAWRDPAAWQGTTRVGGLELPGEVTGSIALNELVLHGWDLARATGQRFEPTPEDVVACTPFVASMAEPGHEAARQGLFGPVVPVPDGATPFERLLGLSGRNPAWTPPAAAAPPRTSP